MRRKQEAPKLRKLCTPLLIAEWFYDLFLSVSREGGLFSVGPAILLQRFVVAYVLHHLLLPIVACVYIYIQCVLLLLHVLLRSATAFSGRHNDSVKMHTSTVLVLPLLLPMVACTTATHVAYSGMDFTANAVAHSCNNRLYNHAVAYSCMDYSHCCCPQWQ